MCPTDPPTAASSPSFGVPKGASLAYRYWTIPRVNPVWFSDPKLGALLLRYDGYRVWWDQQLKRSPDARALVPASLQADVKAFVDAPVPRAVELLRLKVVDDPLFNERSTHEGLSWSYEARHRAGDAEAIYEFAIVDPDARTAGWVSEQESAWQTAGNAWRLRRFDSSIRARRGGRTSRAELRSLVQRDQRIFAAVVEAIEKGQSRLRAILEITGAIDGVTDSLVKKVCREYLPVYAVARAVDRTSTAFFSDLMNMTSLL